mmetsp:Transcript_14224/g.53440  ORF Transcript_14224/g.53440 Transcript_14224/m.53440 type:complete len:103 (+) Transcript_14224:120-428(+)
MLIEDLEKEADLQEKLQGLKGRAEIMNKHFKEAKRRADLAQRTVQRRSSGRIDNSGSRSSSSSSTSGRSSSYRSSSNPRGQQGRRSVDDELNRLKRDMGLDS